MPLLNQFRGHDKYPTLGGYGIDFQNCELYLPLWLARSKAASGGTFKSFDKNGHTLTVTGATWTPPYGYTLNGIDNLITIPDSSSLNIATGQVTLIGVIKPNTFPAYTERILVKATDVNNRAYGISVTSTGLLSYDVGNNTYSGVRTLPDGVWSQIGSVFDNVALTVTFYINGVAGAPVGTGAMSDTTGSNLLIGNFPGLARWFKGGLAEIYVCNRALTAVEVMQHYLSAKRRMPWCNLP